MSITDIPLEIIHMILEFVVHPGDDFEAGRLTWETRRALRACSLISYLWLVESRKRLFRTIPVPCTDTSLHAFKRLFSSPNLTFGPADVLMLDVTGKAPSSWGWQWWRTHQRKVKGERERTKDTHWDTIRVFDRFFDWLPQDPSAGRILRGLGELRLFEVAFESPSLRESGWVSLSLQTQHSLRRSFPSLTKLVLHRVRFCDNRVFTSFLGSFTNTLQVLEMECVEIDYFDPFGFPGGKLKEPLLPTLHTLRTTGTAVELTVYLTPLPNLRTASFDIGDEDLRKERISVILADALSSSEHLQKLSFQNSCSGSYRNAEPLDNGPFLTGIIEKAPSIEHLKVDVRTINTNAHLVPMFSQKHPIPSLTSLHIPELSKFRGDYGLLDDTLKHAFPQLQALHFNLRVANTAAMMAKRRTAVPSLPFPSMIPVPMIASHGVDGDEEVRDDIDFPLEVTDVPYDDDIVAEAQLFSRMDRAARQAHFAKVETTLERLRKEEEEFVLKTRDQRSHEAFEKFGSKMPWCYEERGCLRPIFFYDK